MCATKQACRHCGSLNTIRNGSSFGLKRYSCHDCRRSFGDTEPRYSDDVKSKCFQMYLNNVGIRKIALLLGASPAGVLLWIRKRHAELAAKARRAIETVEHAEADVIEMDEIYTYVEKNATEPSCGLLILGDKVVLLRLK
jgi:transposase-like protein